MKIRISGEARQIFDTIMRKTYGFQKKEDKISLSQFVESTGLSKTAICKAINKLTQMNLIYKKISITKKVNDNIATYGIVKDYDAWKPLPKKGMNKGCYQKGKSPLPKKRNTKETLTKEIKRLCDKPHVDKSKSTEIKLGDPVYPFIIERLQKLGKKLFKIEIEYSKIGSIYKQAGDIGQAVVALNRAIEWAQKDRDYFLAVKRELNQRRGKIINNVQCAGWKDTDWEDVKAHNNTFDLWIDKEFNKIRGSNGK